MAHMWGAHLAPTLRGACDLLARDVRYSTYFSEVPTQAWEVLFCNAPCRIRTTRAHLANAGQRR